jgi:NADH:ubiquinone oxidoreductase subunit 3 (subunit A)
MKQLVIVLMILTLSGLLAVFAATLHNTDSQEYELQIQESGRPYASGYRIGGQAKVEICFYGCEMTFLATGQRVRVNVDDSVVISNRIMYVQPGR